jgi:hypothetical protein
VLQVDDLTEPRSEQIAFARRLSSVASLPSDATRIMPRDSPEEASNLGILAKPSISQKTTSRSVAYRLFH